ncbi:tricalbin, partial [Aureobasidium melanogenum]|uniref:Tricalbin n=1 Tax=Aureobasidium melanogenum (strain CBS 110374) TaxID=1043003 RepID=A0A074VMV9_AURM1
MLDGLHNGHSKEELKSQGAIEAARDPHSKVTAADAEQKILEESKKGGAAAFEFDVDASATEKARQVKARLPPELQHVHKHQTAVLASDQDDSIKPAYDIPTAPLSAALPSPSKSTAESANDQTHEKEEDWAKVGWAPRFGQLPDSASVQGENLLDHQTMLEAKLDDKFFGDWYHNTGVIIFACLSSWVVAVLGGGLGWVFIVMAVCGTYYRTSIRRVRRNFRDDVNREMAKARIETDVESLEWINSFLVKFWPIYAPVICSTIISSVDQVLSTSTPAFLDSMRMKFFTLGTKPPRLEHVKTYPKAEDDIVLMDWKFSFTPNDTADLTARQIKNKINPKVILEIRLGKGMVSKGMDIIVEDMAFSGLMRVKMKLQIPFPHIEKVEICFLERPKIDYVCKPLGGDTFGFDINFIPGLESFIQEQIHANLGPMMYQPNVFPIEIAKMLAGNPVDQAIGVLQITFHGAQGLRNPDKFSGTPDPYCTVSINNRDVLGKTKTVHENANPRWNETINVVLTSLKDALTLQVYDYNEFRKDKELGIATFALDQLENQTEFESQQLEVMANGRARGLISADIRFFPVLEGEKLPDGTVQPPPESNTGIAKFTIESAKELDGSKSMIGQLNPYPVLLLNGKEIHVGKKLKRTNNPIFPDATKELLITDRKKAKLGLVIKDDRDMSADPIIGTYQLKLDDMLELMHRGQEWYNLAGVKTGRAKMLLQWKPVALKGALGGSGGYVTPIGVMRLHFQNARDLRNLETLGKSDPYVRVMLSGVLKGRTVTWKNNLNPDFDEIVYIPVHSTREKLSLEVMDEEKLGKDRLLGMVELAVSDYAHQDESGEYLVDDSKKLLSSGLRMGATGSAKGVLNFTASFFPTLNVIDPEDEEKEDKSSLDVTESTKEPPTPTLDARPEGRTRSNTAGTIGSLKLNPAAAEMRQQLAANENKQDDGLPVKKEVPRVRIGADDLANYESGLLVFKIIDGDLAVPGSHLEIIMDDMLFASYTSSKTRSKHYVFNETGDAMVRELDLSRITMRLVEEVDSKGDDEHDKHIKAKVTGQTLEVLKSALYTPTKLALKDSHGRDSFVTVSLKYLPVKMKLDPSESINNQGNLRVEVLDAADLPAADRNGYSDPYCKFTLNGKEVFKSKTQKKTLHPAWNEFFEVPIRSRTAANFQVDVFDWDFGDKADFLGKAAINLDILEPFRRQEVTLGLDGKSGSIRLGMLFKPDYVTRSRQGSSTFHGTFAAPGKIVGAPVKGVGKGAVFVGGNVVRGASFLGRGFRRRKSNAEQDTDEVITDDTPMPGMSTGAPLVDQQSPEYTVNVEGPGTPHSRTRSFGNNTTSPTSSETGTASISVLSAAGFPAGTKVEVKIMHDGPQGLKEIIRTKPLKTKGEEVSWSDLRLEKKLSCTADSSFRVVVSDHHTFGNGAELGEAQFFLDDQGAGGEKEVKVGSGSVTVRSSWRPSTADSASMLGSIRGSPGGANLGGSIGRRSFMGRRERSVTPSAPGQS